MKVENMIKLLLILYIILLSQNPCTVRFYQQEIHKNAQYSKILNLDDQNVLVFSFIIGTHKILEYKLDKKGELLYTLVHHNLSFSYSDILIAPHSDSNQDILLFHTNEKLLNLEIIQFNGFNISSTKKLTLIRNFIKKSVLPLKNGKVLIAGIKNKYVQNKIFISIYDPKSLTLGYEYSIEENTTMISCYE